MFNKRMSILGNILRLLVRLYQLIISPYLGRSCRFYPSCSHYTLQALEKYGALKGMKLSIRRIGKCHPWNAGGIDNVP